MAAAEVGAGERFLKVLDAREKAMKQSSVTAPPPSWCKTLYLRNLPYDAEEAEVADLFRDCGKVKAVRFVANSGRFKGFAYLDFASPDALAVALRKKVRLRGRLVELDFDTGGARAGFKYRPEAYDSNYAPAKR
jgi:nucleolin